MPGWHSTRRSNLEAFEKSYPDAFVELNCSNAFEHKLYSKVVYARRAGKRSQRMVERIREEIRIISDFNSYWLTSAASFESAAAKTVSEETPSRRRRYYYPKFSGLARR